MRHRHPGKNSPRPSGLARAHLAGTLLLWSIATLAPAQSTQRAAAAATPIDAQSFTQWIDGVWVNHLRARSDAFANAPLLREAFLRDALRVNPGDVETITSLTRHYRAFSMQPMDHIMMALGLRLVPSRNEWAALAEGSSGDQRPARAWSDDDEALHRAASEKFAARRFMEAEVDLRNLLLAHPEEERLLIDLGLLYAQTTDWAMGAAVFSHAHTLFPENFDAANNLAICLGAIDRPDLVPAVLITQLKQRPDDVYLISNISIHAKQAGDLETAREYAGRWVALAPADEAARDHLRSLIPPAEATP